MAKQKIKIMTKTIRYILISTIIGFSSCDILDPDSSSISSLDSKINFKVIESFDNYESVSIPQIFIELQTEKIYGCSNFRIKTNYTVKEKTIEIEILGIDKSGSCATSLGPANERIKLGELSGIYEIEISYRNFDDTYNLLISDSLIILDGKETSNTKPLLYFAFRYPKNSFAFLCGATSENIPLCESFIDTLKGSISITEFHFSQIAEIPYPNYSLGYNYSSPVRFFYYNNEEDYDKIKVIMKNYKQSYFNEGGASLLITNWMNKKIRSWLL